MNKTYTKFLKFKNVYGIKELKNLDRISKDTIIYAPNGVMKTSFADGLYNISNNQPIIDAFGKELADFEIEQNSKIYSPTDNDGEFQCIVYSGKYLKSDIFNDPAIASMAMSASLKESYLKERNELESIRDELDRICSINVKNGKKKSNDSWLSIRSIFGGENIEEFIDNLLSIDAEQSKDFGVLSFNALCNDKVTSLYSNPNFLNKLSLYRDVVEKKVNEEIFNSGFTFAGLIEVRDTVKKTNYFDASHKMVIGNQMIETLNQLDQFIEKQKDLIFSSDEVIEAYSEVTEMLNSNANTRNFAKLLIPHYDLLVHDNDIISKQKFLVRSKLIGLEDELINLKQRKIKLNSNLTSILARASEEQSTWKKVKDIFNFRFSLNRVDLKLAYVFEDGYPVPKIIQIDKSTGKDLGEAQINRLSDGKKRALYILNLLFEIESKKLEWHDGILLILDDVADSFDYQNKYAISKYIQELYEDPSFHVITLTHNFDFYRCCSYFLSKLKISGCFAQKHRNSIKLINGISKEYLSLSFSSNWRGRLGGSNNSHFENITTFFSMLPIIRNECEIEESINGENYKLLCELLHRRRDIHCLTLTKFKDIFDQKISKNLDPVYYSVSYDELIKICYEKLTNSSIDDLKLSSKMACAVLLRIFYEEFIISKTKNDKILLDEKANEKVDRLYSELEKSGRLSPEQIAHCEFASIICNPYVHVNSFMYEQLIDNSADKLVDFMKYFADESHFFDSKNK